MAALDAGMKKVSSSSNLAAQGKKTSKLAALDAGMKKVSSSTNLAAEDVFPTAALEHVASMRRIQSEPSFLEPPEKKKQPSKLAVIG